MLLVVAQTSDKMVVMGGYINNVLSLFCKHYVENWPKYLGAALLAFVMPIVFAYMSDEATAAVTAGSRLIIVYFAYVIYISIRELRNRYTYIMATTLPVTTAERYGFILLNSTVVLFAWYVVCLIVAVKLSLPLFPMNEDFMWVLEKEHLLANINYIIGLIGTHAGLLMVNLVPTKRLIVNYFVALLIVVAYQWMLSKYVDVVDRESFKLWSNIVVTLVSWTVGYFLVRKYQYKG